MPLQRPAKYANQEFFTEAQRAELDKERATIVQRRGERTTGVGDADVTGGLLLNPTGTRTSLIVDPPDGRIPPLTPEAEKAAAADREFRLALLQATETCKNKLAACAAALTIRSPRRNALNLLRATMPLSLGHASIATTDRRVFYSKQDFLERQDLYPNTAETEVVQLGAFISGIAKIALLNNSLGLSSDVSIIANETENGVAFTLNKPSDSPEGLKISPLNRTSLYRNR